MKFNKEDPTTWPYPCLVKDILGEIYVLELNDRESSSTFHSELPPEGWVNKGELPRKVNVYGDIYTLYFQKEEISIVSDVNGSLMWVGTSIITEIDPNREEKLRKIAELEEELKQLKSEIK